VSRPRREGMTAECVTIYEKTVSSLFTNGPEKKMQRQVVSTMQSWDIVLEVRLPPQREGMKHRLTATMKIHIYVCVAVSLSTYQPPLPL